MGLKDKFKLMLLPFVVSTALLVSFFIGGARYGATYQRELDQPVIEDCVNQLIGSFELNDLDGGVDAGTP